MPTDYPPSTNVARGFSLIELLVVLTIIAALVAIVLAALGQVQERGRKATCQSNLRQVALAMQQYVQDNDGAYPRAYGAEAGADGAPVAADWNHLILPYIKTVSIFHCPTSPNDAPNKIGVPLAQQAKVNDYEYNARRLNLWPRTGPKGVNESLLGQTATLWLNADSGWMSLDGEYHYLRRVEATSCGRAAVGATLHSGGGNYSFLDGHVQWLTPEAFGEIECKNEPLPRPFKD